MDQDIVETVFELVMRKLFGVYFIQIITLLLLIFMVFSGNLKRFFTWLFSFKKVSVGKVTLDNGDVINERRHEKRRQSDADASFINKEMDNLLQEINKKLNQFDKRFEDIEYLLGKVSQGTLENMLHDETGKQSMFKRLKAFRRLTAMGVNSRVKQYGLKLILENKETWYDVLDTKLDIPIVDNGYYSNVLVEINRRIFESGGYIIK